MALEISIDGEIVFSNASEQCTLIPLDEYERDKVQKSLIAALATLSGITPQLSTVSKEIGSDPHFLETVQYSDPQRDDVVVLLSERLCTRNNSKEPKSRQSLENY